MWAAKLTRRLARLLRGPPWTSVMSIVWVILVSSAPAEVEDSVTSERRGRLREALRMLFRGTWKAILASKTHPNLCELWVCVYTAFIRNHTLITTASPNNYDRHRSISLSSHACSKIMQLHMRTMQRITPYFHARQNRRLTNSRRALAAGLIRSPGAIL